MCHPVMQLALTKHCSNSLGTHKGLVFIDKNVLRHVTNIMAASFLEWFPHASSIIYLGKISGSVEFHFVLFYNLASGRKSKL